MIVNEMPKFWNPRPGAVELLLVAELGEPLLVSLPQLLYGGHAIPFRAAPRLGPTQEKVCPSDLWKRCESTPAAGRMSTLQRSRRPLVWPDRRIRA